MCTSDCFLICLAILFPPVSVWIKRGICSADSIINIALCCLGYLPGLFHAWYIISKYPDPYEFGYVTVVDTETGHGYHHRHHQHCQPQQDRPQYHERMVYTVPAPRTESPAPRVADGYGSFEPLQSQRYQPGEDSSTSQSQPPPPSYASVVKGDSAAH